MKKAFAVLCTVGILLSLSAPADAQKGSRLLGSTLNKQVKAGVQPATKVRHAYGPATTTTCPFDGSSTLQELLAYVREHFPQLYRQALGFRRAGQAQIQIRNWLETNVCNAGNSPWPNP